MTHSYMWHNSFSQLACPLRRSLRHVWNMVHSYIWNNFFVRVQKRIGCLIIVGHSSQKNTIISGSFAERDLKLKASYASPSPFTCEKMHAYVWHDSFWIIHMCDMTHSYVWHISHVCDMTHPCVTWLSHVCDKTYSESFTCVTWVKISPVTHMSESCHTY